MKYRSKIEIIVDMLEIARKGAKKTHIIYRGNLSFKLANLYLKAVEKAGLLAFKHESGYYVLTEKGKKFVAKFQEYCSVAETVAKQNAVLKDEMDSLEQMCFGKNLASRRNSSENGKLKKPKNSKSLSQVLVRRANEN